MRGTRHPSPETLRLYQSALRAWSSLPAPIRSQIIEPPCPHRSGSLHLKLSLYACVVILAEQFSSQKISPEKAAALVVAATNGAT